ncbi:hypothetical protein C8R45DRAFT_932826 [Mycena sanguinolenta]|nr:hypothetical protein C8R45DRAFT_932826 [Mycena sanguinolenta]
MCVLFPAFAPTSLVGSAAAVAALMPQIVEHVEEHRKSTGLRGADKRYAYACKPLIPLRGRVSCRSTRGEHDPPRPSKMRRDGRPAGDHMDMDKKEQQRGDGRRTTDNGQRTTDNGQRATDDERTVGNGRGMGRERGGEGGDQNRGQNEAEVGRRRGGVSKQGSGFIRRSVASVYDGDDDDVDHDDSSG